MERRYLVGEIEVVVRIEPTNEGYHITVGDRAYHVILRHMEAGALTLDINGHQRRAVVAAAGPRSWVALDGATYAIEQSTGRHGRARSASADNTLAAAMPGQVVAVYATAGDAVEAGQPLLLLTAMKMELTLAAPHDGRVGAVHVAPGDVVERGQLLMRLET